MKNLFSILLFFPLTISINAQSIIGAWEVTHTSEEGEPVKSVLVFTDKFQVITTFHAETGKFIATNGGSYSLEGTTMTETTEFNTGTPENVGRTKSFEIVLTENTVGMKGGELIFKRIDNGSPGALQGAWLMSGRIRDGQTQTRDVNRPRKTMKILSGTRFQWIAYNTETKQFMGTGGGTYTTIDGKYTEHIEFFSRDDSRVGASLEFDYEMVNGNWHHKGFSSKGAPLYEIWSIRQN